MSYSVTRPEFLARFACLGDRCEDTCCVGWNMQMDAKTHDAYVARAPELLAAVVENPDGSFIMKRDAETDYCVKLEGGLCGIHKQYGGTMLGDACYFYPRVTRKLGDAVIMTAIASCPETARLALFDAHAFQEGTAEEERLPQSLTQYLPEGLEADAALDVHRQFLRAAQDEAASPERILLRLHSVAQSLERVAVKDWAGAAPVFLMLADGRLAEAESSALDPFNIVHALIGLMTAARKKPSTRLQQIVATIGQALHMDASWERTAIATHEDSVSRYLDIRVRWETEFAKHYAPMLRRWIALQLSVSLFPFSGFGNTLSQRISIIGVRYATVRLALMCAQAQSEVLLGQEEVVRAVYSIARVLDHLQDPAFSIQIYEETGWIKESRLRGLLEN